MTDEPLLTVAEVAGLLRVWPETVRIWLQSDKLKGMKLPGGDWRIQRGDLDEMLMRNGTVAPK